MIDLRHGAWQDVLADVAVNALVSDPPYSARVHKGHAKGAGHATKATTERQELSYAGWTPEQARAFAAHWAERTTGWICIQSCHELAPHYAGALREAGWYVFAPIPCVIRGMTVRMAGDGPSSWCVWMTVARRKTRKAASWGTLPGAYVVARGSDYIGGKPLSLMGQIVGDYTREGDLVCDPCAGLATTALACARLGRRFVGAEADLETYSKAMARLKGGVEPESLGRGEQMEMF